MKTIKFIYLYIFSTVFLSLIVGTAFLIKRQGPLKRPQFALLTDFGNDFAVASIKGVVLTKLPDAQITDLDHSIVKFNIGSGGWVLAEAYRYFPKGTVFICVIDPGVGTERVPLCIQTPDYTFVGPNNGIFDYILETEKIRTIYKINESYLQSGLQTFHGRDLFAPAAIDASLSNMKRFALFDESQLKHLPRKEDTNYVVYIDSFGNIKTDKAINVSVHRHDKVTFSVKDKKYTVPFVKTFDDVTVGSCLCYEGSNRTIEIAINQGSAAQKLGIDLGEAVIFEL